MNILPPDDSPCIVGWLVLLNLVVAGCRPQGETLITVGMELDYPPFEMTDPRGCPTGVSVDLAHTLSEHLHQPVNDPRARDRQV